MLKQQSGLFVCQRIPLGVVAELALGALRAEHHHRRRLIIRPQPPPASRTESQLRGGVTTGRSRWVDGDPDGTLANGEVSRVRANLGVGDSAAARIDSRKSAVLVVGDPDCAGAGRD